MTANAGLPNPHDERLIVRNGTYPNAEAEREAVAQVDNAVWDLVRPFERLAIDAAQKFDDTARANVTEAATTADALYADITYALQKQVAMPTQATARELENLRGEARKLIAALERAEQDADWHIDRLSDISTAHREFLEKWPILKRPLHL